MGEKTAGQVESLVIHLILDVAGTPEEPAHTRTKHLSETFDEAGSKRIGQLLAEIRDGPFEPLIVEKPGRSWKIYVE